MHALCMSLEHERMHQETLCYMLAQQRKLDFMAATKQQGQAAGSDSSMEGTSVGQPAAQVISVASEPAVAAGTGVQPFYLQQCSYLSTSAAGRPVGGNPPFCIAAALPARDEGDGQEGEGGSTGENGTVEKFRAVPATTVSARRHSCQLHACLHLPWCMWRLPSAEFAPQNSEMSSWLWPKWQAHMHGAGGAGTGG